MTVGAFYKPLGYLAIGTSVSGLAWLSCCFFPLPAFLWLYFTVVLCMSKLRLEREGRDSEQQRCAEFHHHTGK